MVVYSNYRIERAECLEISPNFLSLGRRSEQFSAANPRIISGDLTLHVLRRLVQIDFYLIDYRCVWKMNTATNNLQRWQGRISQHCRSRDHAQLKTAKQSRNFF